MINAKEAHELSMNSISMLCDTAIKDAAKDGKFVAKVSFKGRKFTDREVFETMKELDGLGYHTCPMHCDNRIYINLEGLIISWR